MISLSPACAEISWKNGVTSYSAQFKKRNWKPLERCLSRRKIGVRSQWHNMKPIAYLRSCRGRRSMRTETKPQARYQLLMTRDTVFISHANPHDNDFVRWLGARLTGHGYKVWADLFELKGGNPFWSTIEEALRHHACKMIFVVSKASVDPDRTGALNELSVADALKKQLKDDSFIIPLKIDATAFSEFPIQIHRLNAIDFSAGWGAKLAELLDTLECADVPKVDGDQRVEFERWRATMARTSTTVEVASEKVLTNLLPIASMPSSISFYEYDGDNTKIAAAMKGSGIPHGMFNRHIISFSAMSEIQGRLPPSFTLGVRAHAALDKFLDGAIADPSSPMRDEARKMVTSLLRQHIESYLTRRGLKEFKTPTASAFYFPGGLVPNDKVQYLAASGRRTNKNVVGRSERYKVHWHLAMKVNVVLATRRMPDDLMITDEPEDPVEPDDDDPDDEGCPDIEDDA
jgi:hypothetical protein